MVSALGLDPEIWSMCVGCSAWNFCTSWIQLRQTFAPFKRWYRSRWWNPGGEIREERYCWGVIRFEDTAQQMGWKVSINVKASARASFPFPLYPELVSHPVSPVHILWDMTSHLRLLKPYSPHSPPPKKPLLDFFFFLFYFFFLCCWEGAVLDQGPLLSFLKRKKKKKQLCTDWLSGPAFTRMAAIIAKGRSISF